MARAFCAPVAVAVALLLCSPVAAHAQRGARTSVNRSGSVDRNANINRNADVNRNADINRNTDINRNADLNRNVNVNNVNVNRNADVDVDRGVWGGYGGCCYHSGVGTAAAVATSAAVTAAVVGTRVYTLPPSCTAVVAAGLRISIAGARGISRSLSGRQRRTSS